MYSDVWGCGASGYWKMVGSLDEATVRLWKRCCRESLKSLDAQSRGRGAWAPDRPCLLLFVTSNQRLEKKCRLENLRDRFVSAGEAGVRVGLFLIRWRLLRGSGFQEEVPLCVGES